MRSRKVHSYLLVLLCVVLALAGPVAGAMKATFATGSRAGDAAALGRMLSMRLEDGVAPELTVDLNLYRRVLAGREVSYSALNPNKAACLGSCPPPGGPYGRGCEKIYGCHGN